MKAFIFVIELLLALYSRMPAGLLFELNVKILLNSPNCSLRDLNLKWKHNCQTVRFSIIWFFESHGIKTKQTLDMAKREIFQAWGFNGLVQPIPHISAPRIPHELGESEVWEQFLTCWKKKWDSTFGGHIAMQQNFLKAFVKFSFQKFCMLFYLYLLQKLLLSSLEVAVN